MNDDWRERFEANEIWQVALAGARPDRGIALLPHEGTVQAYGWHVDTGELTRLTDRPDGLVEAWVDPLGEYVYYLRDEDGTEQGHLVRVPSTGGDEQDLTPGLPDYTLRGLGFDASGGLLAINPINRDGFALYTITLGKEPGEPRLLHRDRWETWGALLSPTGLAACWSTARAGGLRHYTLLAFDVESGEQVGELDDGRSASVVGVSFTPAFEQAGSLDASRPRPAQFAGRLLATTTRSGFERPVLWDPRTGERRDLPLPSLSGDIAPLGWSPDGGRLLLCQLAGAQRLHVYDLATDECVALDHPPGRYYDNITGGVTFAATGEIVGLRHTSTAPPDVVALDPGTGEQRRILLRSAAAPPGRPWRSVTFNSSDGAQVQAWLVEPDGDGPHPTIVELHGGPHWAFTESYDCRSQAWADNGYAWLGVNQRGSTGFGAAFAEQIWGDLGHWELEDAAAGRAWLIEQGIARPGEILILGGSFGGYLTLLAAGKQPDLWAGAIAFVAIGDLAATYEEMSPALRGALTAWMKGTPAERPAAYEASSPITYAADVAVPVLVVQGRNDSRTPAGQLIRYEERLRSLGKEIEVDWFDAGHQSIGPQMWIRLQERVMAFADRVLARGAVRAG